MEQSINYKQNIIKKKCNECKRRESLDKSHQICQICYNIKTIIKPKQSGNKVIDDFIRCTQINLTRYGGGQMEFVPYEQFKNIEFIAEGGFSKIYKATWVDGPIWNWYDIIYCNAHKISRSEKVVLKKLNNSKNITSKELNELKVFYQICTNATFTTWISNYYGITQEPNTKDLMIIMPYYDKGDLIHYLCNDFYNISWETKLLKLSGIALGLGNIHDANIIHRDLHSGNIFFGEYDAYVGDLGISKSATESTDNNNEKYGIVPYMAPEIFQGQKYTKASDVYSFGMIMWEFMTGRRPFWDETHDTELIIKICDGSRPPIVTNAPEGYIDLMKDCWHSDPEKRPTTGYIYNKINNIWSDEYGRINRGTETEIIKSVDIGPVTINNPGAIYKSRPLSGMIQSAMSLRSSRSQSINLEFDPFYYYQKNNFVLTGKRKFKNDLVKDNDDQNIKKRKLCENEINDYFTKELELDINANFNQHHKGYITREINIDINNC